MAQVAVAPPIVISIAKAAEAVAMLVITLIPLPRDIVAPITANAIKITNKLIVKSSTYTVLALERVRVMAIGSKPLPPQPVQVPQPTGQAAPAASLPPLS